MTRLEFGRRARPATNGEYHLLWRKNPQNLQVRFNSSHPNALKSPLAEDLQSLRELSELLVDFGQNALLIVRLWLRDIMKGHEVRKVHFNRLTHGRESEMKK